MICGESTLTRESIEILRREESDWHSRVMSAGSTGGAWNGAGGIEAASVVEEQSGNGRSSAVSMVDPVESS